MKRLELRQIIKETLNELSFTGADIQNQKTIRLARNDILYFIKVQKKKLNHKNTLDTYHLIKNILNSPGIISKVKEIK